MNSIYAADALCGRCCIDDLPQQSLMELLIADVPNASNVYEGANMTADDCCTWKGIACTDGIVQRISWAFQFAPASVLMHLRYVPARVTEPIMLANGMRETVEMTSLPRELRPLNLGINWFHDSVPLGEMAFSIVTFSMQRNALSGSIDLQGLPPTVQSLALVDQLDYASSNAECTRRIQQYALW